MLACHDRPAARPSPLQVLWVIRDLMQLDSLMVFIAVNDPGWVPLRNQPGSFVDYSEEEKEKEKEGKDHRGLSVSVSTRLITI